MKLNQLIAVLSGSKKKAALTVSELYKKIQKNPLFYGSYRTYSPLAEDGYVYPSESQKVTLTVDSVIQEYVEAVKDFFNLTCAQDKSNTVAVADIKIGDTIILQKVPVTHLLFLEKQLNDLKTFISKLPTLPLDKEWVYDKVKQVYVTPEKLTVKTKKITDYVVVVAPTDKHPAEVRERTVDINEGTWSLTEHSGALSDDEVKQLLKKVETLLQAVIFAREEANNLDIKVEKVSEKLFDYLFG